VVILLIFVTAILSAREVDFAWEAFENARAYQIQVATEIEFNNVIFKKLSLKPNLTADLPYGQMYYRVRAIDKNKKPGVWSEPGLIVVKPYAPELQAPSSEQQYVLFKKEVEIPFRWQPQDQARYVLLIKKDNGEKVFEEEVRSPNFTWSTASAGNYSWQVRSIHNDIHFSDYSSPRKIRILQREMGAPLLIQPQNNANVPAYRKVKFTWEYFPPSDYSHFEIKGPASKSWSLQNKDFHKLESIPPGTYQWRVGSSESKDSPRVYSEWQNIHVSEEMISDKDHYIGMRLHYRDWGAKYKSNRAAADSGEWELEDTQFLREWYGNYQISKHSGLRLSFIDGEIDGAAPYSFSDMTLAFAFRFGTTDYRQSFILGIKQTSHLEYWQESGLAKNNIITGRSLLFGIQMLGRLNNTYRLHIDIQYASPSSQHGNGDLGGDQFLSQIGVSRKVFKKIWASYYVAYERNVLRFENDSQGKTSWKGESFYPLRLALEYRH
tara:strand:- start:7089 stop:8567 length:1479 start_codon:yes stop_codon:yes gene_type:complete